MSMMLAPMCAGLVVMLMGLLLHALLMDPQHQNHVSPGPQVMLLVGLFGMVWGVATLTYSSAQERQAQAQGTDEVSQWVQAIRSAGCSREELLEAQRKGFGGDSAERAMARVLRENQT